MNHKSQLHPLEQHLEKLVANPAGVDPQAVSAAWRTVEQSYQEGAAPVPHRLADEVSYHLDPSGELVDALPFPEPSLRDRVIGRVATALTRNFTHVRNLVGRARHERPSDTTEVPMYPVLDSQQRQNVAEVMTAGNNHPDNWLEADGVQPSDAATHQYSAPAADVAETTAVSVDTTVLPRRIPGAHVIGLPPARRTGPVTEAELELGQRLRDGRKVLSKPEQPEEGEVAEDTSVPEPTHERALFVPANRWMEPQVMTTQDVIQMHRRRRGNGAGTTADLADAPAVQLRRRPVQAAQPGEDQLDAIRKALAKIHDGIAS